MSTLKNSSKKKTATQPMRFVEQMGSARMAKTLVNVAVIVLTSELITSLKDEDRQDIALLLQLCHFEPQQHE